jgi:hypothetical protein
MPVNDPHAIVSIPLLVQAPSLRPGQLQRLPVSRTRTGHPAAVH